MYQRSKGKKNRGQKETEDRNAARAPADEGTPMRAMLEAENFLESSAEGHGVTEGGDKDIGTGVGGVSVELEGNQYASEANKEIEED